MILTFEIDENGGYGLDIHCDEEGRDRLIEILQNLHKPGDHDHLFRFVPGDGGITPEQFDEGSKLAESVVIWLLGKDEPTVKAE